MNINEEENEVQIVPITTRITRNYKVSWRVCTSIELSEKNIKVCILCDKVNTIPMSKLGQKVGYLDEGSYFNVVTGMGYYARQANEKITSIGLSSDDVERKGTVVVTQEELLKSVINGIEDLTSSFNKANSIIEK